MSLYVLPNEILDIITNFVSHITDVIRLERTSKRIRESSRRRKWIYNDKPIPWSIVRLYSSIKYVSGKIGLEFKDDPSTLDMPSYQFTGYPAGFITTVCKYKERRAILQWGEAVFEYNNKMLNVGGKPSASWAAVSCMMWNTVEGLEINVDIGAHDYYYLSNCFPSKVSVATLTIGKQFQADTFAFLEMAGCKSIKAQWKPDCIYTKDDLKRFTSLAIVWVD